jgi:inner membrane protein involved in colicin E2 resistance
VLLGLEAYLLLIGSLLLFSALELVVYALRKIDWSVAGRDVDAVE